MDFIPRYEMGFTRRMVTVTATGLFESLTFRARLDHILEVCFLN
jgi:hypothetical protein